MRGGHYIICWKCGAIITDCEWSWADEWFCDCGEQGMVNWAEMDDDEWDEGVEPEAEA